MATQRQALKAVARAEASRATSSDRSSHHQSVKGMITCARLHYVADDMPGYS